MLLNFSRRGRKSKTPSGRRPAWTAGGRLAEPADTGPLKDAIRRWQNQGDLEGQLADARLKLGKSPEAGCRASARLPLWFGTLEELEKIAVPPGEAIERFAAQEMPRKSPGCLNEEIEELQNRCNAAEQKLEHIQLEERCPQKRTWQPRGRCVTWAALGARRVARGLPQPPTAGRVLRIFPPRPIWPRHFHAASRRRMKSPTGFAGRQVGLHSEPGSSPNVTPWSGNAEGSPSGSHWPPPSVRRSPPSGKLARRSAGMEPLSPQGMQAWILQQRNLMQQAEAVRSQQDAVEQIVSRIQTLRSELAQCLDDLNRPDATCGGGVPPAQNAAETAASQDNTLHAWLQRARDGARPICGGGRPQGEAAPRTPEIGERLEHGQAKAERAEADLNTWRRQWAMAIEPLGLGPDTLPEMADHVLAQTTEIFAAAARPRIYAIASRA